MIKHLVLISFLSIGSFKIFSQDKATEIKQLLTDFSIRSLQEKIYLHIDKPYYAPGDTLWFKAYVVDAITHQPDSSSQTVYVDFVRKNSGWNAAHQLIKNDGGYGRSSYAIPDSLKEGTYELVAYTNWMRNFSDQLFFRKEIFVGRRNALNAKFNEAELKLRNEIADLQFFPEGGNLIEGLENRVAFKAVNKFGRGVDFNAKIFNSRNDTVATLKSSHLGMGSFILTPIPGVRYFVKIGGTEFFLPSVLTRGYTFFVDNVRSKDQIKVVAKNNFSTKDQPILVGHQRGEVVFVMQSQTEGNSFSWAINKLDIPADGIIQITLFNKNGEPQCERLIYNNAQAPLSASVTTDKARYQPHEKVTVNISVKDFDGTPISGNFSMAVTDNRQVFRAQNGLNISNYLHLVSDMGALGKELKGIIEQPDYYFNSDTPQAATDLDILLMSQGWRRFTWSDVMATSKERHSFKKEGGISIYGKSLLANGKPAKPHGVSLFYSADGTSQFLKTTTDEQGNFAFIKMNVENGCKLFMQSENKHTYLTLIDPQMPAYKPGGSNPDNFLMEDKFDAFKRDQQHWEEMEAKMKAQNVKTLKEVVITEKKDHNVDSRRAMYDGMHATKVTVTDANCKSAQSVLQMLNGRVPGLQIDSYRMGMEAPKKSGNIIQPPSRPFDEPLGETYIVEVRGPKSLNGAHSKIIYLVDGIVTDQVFLNSVSPCSIEAIEVVTTGVSMLNAHGVISVLTKAGSYSQKGPTLIESSPNTLATVVKGYMVSREFYSPKYTAANEAEGKHAPDFRSTLYWNPSIRTDAQGNAKVTFWNSDEKTSAHIILEGISNDGQPVAVSIDYDVE